MRSEEDMLALILGTARDDERIRAVILRGSRASPDGPRDIFQDYDVMYLVTDLEPFVHDLEWIRRFGELMILQLPDEMGDPPPGPRDHYFYLMQFTDGNRIDLCIAPVAGAAEAGRDSQSALLLDKDGIFPPFPPASDRDHRPRPPTARAYGDCCNEFWWVSPYVAKGLWRRELPYARGMLEGYVRKQLTRMLGWYVGIRTDFARNPGKEGRFLEQLLEPDLWKLLLRTYADADYDQAWDALRAMCDLFRRIAIPVAERFGLDYPRADDARVSAHLEHVRSLPRSAREY